MRLQTGPIEIEALVRTVRADADGAVALFLGCVRDHNRGRRVEGLEYHAFDDMARSEMEKIESGARRRFAIGSVALVHRTGRLEIGETSVAVAVAAAHRGDAFEACRWIIDTLKRTVPIWKKELLADGEVWIEGS